MSEVALKEYVEAAIRQESELRKLQFAETKNALELAREGIEHRLSGMNELREQISRERGQFLSRELFDRAVNSLEERIRIMENFKANIDGRVLAVGGILLLIQLAITAAGLFWLKR